MKNWSISFADVDRQSFASKVGNGFMDYRDFFDFEPSIEGIEKAKKSKVLSLELRNTLVNVLNNQYETWGIPLPGQVNQLLKEDVFTVTTGHQLNFLSGPHFFFTKIAATIHLAKMLGEACIPVFWLASEDHDFDEIASTILYGKTIQFAPEYSNAPVGRLKMTRSWMEEIQKAMEYISSPWAKTLIQESYQEGFPLSKCIARLVHACFGKFGLLIVDGDSQELKSRAFALFEREWKEQILSKSVETQNKVLSNYGLEPQVYHRDINLFKINDLNRIRINKGDHDFLQLKPEEISPNALMRPLFQETILPNLAYIGGAAEVAYWAQLKIAFSAFNVQMPVVLLRPSLFFVDPKHLLWLEKWGWKFNDVFSDEQALIKRLIHQQPDQFFAEPFIIDLNSMEQHAREQIEKIDPTLLATLGSEVEKMKGLWRGLEKKVEKAIKQKQEIEVQRIGKIKNMLFPDQVFQERKTNGFQFIHQESQIEELIEILNPIHPQIHAFLV